jgi:hypothetical protein
MIRFSLRYQISSVLDCSRSDLDLLERYLDFGHTLPDRHLFTGV